MCYDANDSTKIYACKTINKKTIIEKFSRMRRIDREKAISTFRAHLIEEIKIH